MLKLGWLVVVFPSPNKILATRLVALLVLLLQPLRWCCVDCVIHHERDVREDQHHRYMWREQAIKEWSWRGSSADINLWTIERNDQRPRRVIMACELCCCLLPQCEALRICRSGFPIATLPKDLVVCFWLVYVMIVSSSTF